jgi:hypothetical protein
MNPIVFALRRPFTVMVGIAAIAMGCALALWKMDVDIFPRLNLPVIYVAQPYGGMDPAQMEGLITNYYEYHFLYISGIHHVESRNVQGVALMRLEFHPGTNMAQAMAETISYVNRSRAFMPPGTVPPFVMRFDTGSVPVGYLVLSSETRSLAEIQDLALFRVRPMFASLPGVSAPPPFGGNQRTVVIDVNPERLRAYHLSPEDVISALSAGNTISPSGNVHAGDKYPIVPMNAIVRQIDDMGKIPLRTGALPAVYLRDVAAIRDATDIPTGYSLVNGRRAIYLLCTKRADASTMSVVHNVKAAIPSMQAVLPDDIHVSFEFDQTPYVTRAITGLATEGALGAILTGLMVLVFLRDWRSVLVVVLNIPLALMAAVIGLWLTGNSINLMTLGGLALAVGILVDEATVEIENIHTQMAHTTDVARAVRRGNRGPAVAGHALHTGRISAVVLYGGGRPRPVRPAVAGGRILDAGFVRAVEHVRPRGIGVAPGARSSARRHARSDVFHRASPRLRSRPGPVGRTPRTSRHRLSGRLRGGHRATRSKARHGHLPGGRHGRVPLTAAGGRRHPLRANGKIRARRPPDDRGESRRRQDRSDTGLRRQHPVDVPDQRRLSMVARSGRGDFADRAEARQRSERGTA